MMHSQHCLCVFAEKLSNVRIFLMVANETLGSGAVLHNAARVLLTLVHPQFSESMDLSLDTRHTIGSQKK